MKTCSRCIYDEKIPGITFDDKGVCNYCKQHDELERQYPSGRKGKKILLQIAEKIKKDGKGKKYDCVVGVSGGCDSSYLLYVAKEIMGLRPLAVHFDNTWNSMTAVENLHRVLKKLDIELYTYVVDNKEFDDMAKSMLKASIPEVDALSDIGLITTLYMAAEKHKVKYLFDGHNFRTEGVGPPGWFYFDGKYIQDIHKRFGTLKMKTFPNLWLWRFVKYLLLNYTRVAPLSYFNLDKEEIKAFLNRQYGWKWYGSTHMDNRFAAYNHYLLNTKFDRDFRVLELSAMVRAGQKTRKEALQKIKEKPTYLPGLVDEAKKRFGLSDKEYDDIINLPVKSHKDYKTYKPMFKAMRPFFWLMLKAKRIPESFYEKYTK